MTGTDWLLVTAPYLAAGLLGAWAGWRARP
jgi:hypothetical protein